MNNHSSSCATGYASASGPRTNQPRALAEPEAYAAGGRAQPGRDGYVLVTVAVMLFALMALGALVIDFGFVRLTQRQMLAATDAAAIEGLRWRDVQQWEQLPAGWLDNASFLQAVGENNAASLVDPISAVQRDAIRHWAAANMVSMMMATKTSDTADPANYGFGPQAQFASTSTGGGLAGPLVAPGQPPVYQPQLQPNNGNATEGDMVSGYYGPDQPGVEQSDYTRNDYSPVASSASGTQPPSMLVRMRRVAPGNTLDQESGVSSSGGAIPFLFGYGAPIDRTSVNQGVSVRGTSIASVGFNPTNDPQIPSSDPYYADYPTIGMTGSVGWAAYSQTNLPANARIGAAAVAIYSDPTAGPQYDQWSPLVSAQAAVTLTVASGGTSLLSMSSNNPAGFLVDPSSWIANQPPQPQNTVAGLVWLGQKAVPTVPTESAIADTLPSGPSPVYVVLVSAANQVIGFGAADEFSYSPATTVGGVPEPATITLTPIQSRVAWSNASASLVQPLQAGVSATSLWTRRAAVQYPLLSPVLVNR